MKVAQFLATIPDALPAEYAEELAQLQANAPPMGWTFVKRRMASELGPDWEQRFAASSTRPRAPPRSARCIARSRRDGTRSPASCNIPTWPAAVEADLRQFNWSCRCTSATTAPSRPRTIHDELVRPPARGTGLRARGGAYAALSRHAGRETDGACAGAGAGAVDQAAADHDLAGGRAAARRGPGQCSLARNAIARNMFRAWYVPFYGYGVIHGDPHLGNYTVRPDTASTCWISAASACSSRAFVQRRDRPLPRARHRRTRNWRFRPTRPGASRIYRAT